MLDLPPRKAEDVFAQKQLLDDIQDSCGHVQSRSSAKLAPDTAFSLGEVWWRSVQRTGLIVRIGHLSGRYRTTFAPDKVKFIPLRHEKGCALMSRKIVRRTAHKTVEDTATYARLDSDMMIF